MKYYLYIIKTLDDKLYCGITTDVLRRFNEHLNLKTGAKYLRAHKPKEIVLVMEFDDKSSALKEEYRIKKTLSRDEKLALIAQFEPFTKKFLKNA